MYHRLNFLQHLGMMTQHHHRLNHLQVQLLDLGMFHHHLRLDQLLVFQSKMEFL